MITPEEAKAAAALMTTGDADERRQAAQIVKAWQIQQGKVKSKFPRKR